MTSGRTFEPEQEGDELDELDRSIDQALQRRFALPDGIDTLATRALQGGRPRARRSLAPLVLLAAAAAVVVLGLWVGEQSAGREEAAPGLAGGAHAVPPRAPVHDSSHCRRVGPDDTVDAEPRGVQRPDLALLYRDMDACQRAASALACGDEDQLAERLAATYGQPVALRPEAASLLNGPFLSERWSTGTILTGTSEDVTSVLVAERTSTLACCVDMRLAKDSGLQMFTWQVGDLVFTEITPFDEPRLLGCFE